MAIRRASKTSALITCFCIVVTAIVAIPWIWPTAPALPAVVESGDLKGPAAVQLVVEAAAKNPLAIIYVNVNWSITAIVFREDFVRFALEWQRTRPDLPVSFHCIDFTETKDYSPLKSLPGWEDARQQLPNFAIHGNGELIWVKDGKIVDLGSMGIGDVEPLIQRTDRNFAGPDRDYQ